MPGLVDFISDAADDAQLAQGLFEKIGQSPDNSELHAFFSAKGYQDVTEADCTKILTFGSDILSGNRDY